MKICPTCRKTYTDDGLNFCLEDGSVLTNSNDVPAETLIMNQAPPTIQSSGLTNPNPQTFGGQAPQQYSLQPQPSSSKTWLWVLGILGTVVILCGGGFVGFFAWVASQADNSNTVVGGDNKGPSPQSKTPIKSGPTGETVVVDLSEWVKDPSPYGTKEFANGELTMGAKQKGYYYVLVAPSEYESDNAEASVTVRNGSDEATNLGYGLIFHSNTTPLIKDYAFVIDAKKQRYRVVRHEPGKEIPVLPWTNSTTIKSGTQENILSARDKGATTDLYINGILTKSIPNTYRYQNGVVGLYSGDGIKATFKNLQIKK